MKTCPKCFFENSDDARFCQKCGENLERVESNKKDPLIGRIIAGNFKISKLIAVGGMGSIYKATQLSLSKEVCIKVLHKHLLRDPTIIKRFHREAKAASRLKHPNCINIIDFGQAENGVLYIAMDYIKGQDLATVLEREFPLDTLRIIKITKQITLALDEAHANGIIHRDLKPENIMLEQRRHEKDFVIVLDFGIAKIKEHGKINKETFETMAGIVCGTPEYMSPEQIRGEDLDPRTDLYSLGVILWQLYTNRLPFTGNTPISIVTKHLTEMPERPSKYCKNIPPAMEGLILKLMSKDRNLRPHSALEVYDILCDIEEALKAKQRKKEKVVDLDKTVIEAEPPNFDEFNEAEKRKSDEIKLALEEDDSDKDSMKRFDATTRSVGNVGFQEIVDELSDTVEVKKDQRKKFEEEFDEPAKQKSQARKVPVKDKLKDAFESIDKPLPDELEGAKNIQILDDLEFEKKTGISPYIYVIGFLVLIVGFIILFVVKISKKKTTQNKIPEKKVISIVKGDVNNSFPDTSAKHRGINSKKKKQKSDIIESTKTPTAALKEKKDVLVSKSEDKINKKEAKKTVIKKEKAKTPPVDKKKNKKVAVLEKKHKSKTSRKTTKSTSSIKEVKKLLKLGNESYQKARYEEAVIYYKLALKRQEIVELYKKIGFCYRHLGKKKEAKKYFLLYLSKIPESKRKVQKIILEPFIKD